MGQAGWPFAGRLTSLADVSLSFGTPCVTGVKRIAARVVANSRVDPWGCSHVQSLRSAIAGAAEERICGRAT